jgi:FMN phosphatase YigB (HAD superfamily)
MSKVVIFDIDGTLANNDHRKHFVEPSGAWDPTTKFKKDWDSFLSAEQITKDTPFPHVVDIAEAFACKEHEILFVTGREERVRDATRIWLHTHVTDRWNQWSFLSTYIDEQLYMRKTGDYRPDHVVKSELADQIIAKGYEIYMVFDDRDAVVKMWRARGIPCMQVAPGDF